MSKQLLQKVLPDRFSLYIYGILLLILIIGGLFRFTNLKWDDDQALHVDERNIINASWGIGVQNLFTVQVSGDCDTAAPREKVSPIPGGLSFFIPGPGSSIRNVPCGQAVPPEAINFWNPQYSPLNPRFYAYGHLPMYMIKGASYLLEKVTGQDWNTNDRLFTLGRFLSATFSLLTVALIFFTARRTFYISLGRKRAEMLALLAAAFLALAVAHIQLAHFLTAESFQTFFVTLTLFFALRHLHRGTLSSAILVGVAFSLALACKFSSLPLLLPVLLAILLGASSRGKALAIQLKESSPETKNRKIRYAGIGLTNLICMLLAAALTFFLAMPYAFIAFTEWTRQLAQENQMVTGAADYFYTRQYAGTIPGVYQISQLVQWGLGWPLGILVLLGSLYSLWQALRLKLPETWILLAWLIPYLALTFSFEVKFSRYLLTVFPVLVIFGARLIFVASQKASIAKLKSYRNLRIVLVTLVLGSTGVYTLSFVNMYQQPHPRISASEWIYANIPAGSTLGLESYDEPLPLPLWKGSYAANPKNAGQYNQIFNNIYWDFPNTNAIENFANKLGTSDYIILSSGRAYQTVQKLPWRYPVQIEYYRLLFDNKLGFEKVGEFSRYPTVPLLDWKINDDKADESFRVYDHPIVFIFKKVTSLSNEQYKQLFSGVANADRVAKDDPFAVNRIEESGFFAKFQPLTLVGWLLLVQLLGLVALPLTYKIFAFLPDRGYTLSKVLGLLLLSYGVWIGSICGLSFSAPIIWGYIVCGFIAVLCWLFFSRRSKFLPELASFMWQRRGFIIIVESLFLIAFLFLVYLRSFTPDIRGTEKYFDYSFLNSLVTNDKVPAPDLWFSGFQQNYYYFGFFILALLTKASGAVPEVAYNLSLPLIFAFTVIGAFGIVYNLVQMYGPRRSRGAYIAGIGGGLLVGVFGNLAPIFQSLNAKPNVWGFYFDWWSPSRVIHDKLPYITATGKVNYHQSDLISEFPNFSFLLNDVHPHVIDLPFVLLGIAISLNLVSAKLGSPHLSVNNWLGRVNLLVMAICIGSLFAIHAWDFPTVLLLVLVAVGFREIQIGKADTLPRYKRRRFFEGLLLGTTTNATKLSRLGRWLGFVLRLGILSLLLYLPFQLNFVAPLGTMLATQKEKSSFEGLPVIGNITNLLGFVNWDKTILLDYLLVFGTFVFAVFSFIIAKFLANYGTWLIEYWRRSLLILALCPGIIYLGWFWRFELLGPLLIALALTVLVLVKELQLARSTLRNVADCLVLILVLFSIGLSLAVELFYFKDGLGTRLNTVFRFYYQIWVFYALASAYSIWWILAGNWKLGWRSKFSGPTELTSEPPVIMQSDSPLQTSLPVLAGINTVVSNSPTEKSSSGLMARRNKTPWGLWGWSLLMVVLLLGGLIYPVMGAWERSGRFAAQPGLNGMTFIQKEYPNIYDATQWLRTEAAKNPDFKGTILEAQQDEYRDWTIFSTFSGFPTVIGWGTAHVLLWRSGTPAQYNDATQRVLDVDEIYATKDITRAKELISRYNIKYVVVGPFETGLKNPSAPDNKPPKKYEAVALAKFASFMKVVYNQNGVTIYE